MNQADRDRTLPDRGGNPLDGAMADVAGDEHAGQAGLQQQRLPLQWPANRRATVSEEVGAGQDKPPSVPQDRLGEPVGVGLGPNENNRQVQRTAM